MNLLDGTRTAAKAGAWFGLWVACILAGDAIMHRRLEEAGRYLVATIGGMLVLWLILAIIGWIARGLARIGAPRSLP
jgi:hypothetical protein